MSKTISEKTAIFNSAATQLNRFFQILQILILILAAQQLVAGAPGDLDGTFGTGGKVFTNIGTGAVTGRGMVIQPDGKIVVAGATNLDNPASDFLVLRYNADGTLDATFDGDGKVTTDFNNKSDAAFAVALQADGKIVVVGASGTNNTDKDFAVARYNADGSLDTTFDGDGRVVTDFGNLNDEAFSVAIATTGKIVAAGTTSSRNGDFAVARYLANGSLDTTFDTDGLVTTDAFCTTSCSNYFDRGRSVAIQPDGKIIVGGDSRPSDSNQARFAVARYLDSGAPDFPFGNGFGKASQNADGCCSLAMATAMALQPDGKIVMVGGSSQFGNQATNGLATVRFQANGFSDFSFHAANVTALGNASVNYKFNSVALQPDGKIVAAANVGSRFLVWRFSPDGSSDVFFGSNGFAITEMNPAASSGGAFAVSVQADGKIVAAGYQHSSGGGEIAVARYLTDGCNATFLSPSDRFFSRIGGSAFLNILAPVGCSWTVVSGAGWVTIVSGGSGTGDGAVTIRVALNTTTQERTTTLTVGTNSVNIRQALGVGVPLRRMFDIENDGRADISVVRIIPGNHIAFYTFSSRDGYRPWIFQGAQSSSLSNFKLVPADYDGDGTTNYAIWDATQARFIINDETNFIPIQFGSAGDIPLPSDWDGDGRADLAVYRPGTASNPQGYFYYRPSNTPGADFTAVPWGTIGDKPVMGDFDGDGKTDAAVFRPSNGVWYVLRSSDNVLFAVQFGISTDKIVAADYDGDGKTDPAVYRDGVWYILQSRDGFTATQFGIASDKPVPADYDGDGKADVAVFRDGTWYLQQSTAGFTAIQFGLGTDAPLEAAYLQ